MLSVKDKAVDSLVKLGFKEYQAKVYYSLVSVGQASATKIHKVSGVPRPRVYDTLDELIKLGAVNYYKSRPIIYKAVDPIEVVERLRKTYLTASDDAITALEMAEHAPFEQGLDLVWVLKRADNIHKKTIQMIEAARKEIFIRFSNLDKYLELGKYLESAKARGVLIKSLIFKKETLTANRFKRALNWIDIREVSPDSGDETGLIPLLSGIFSEKSSLFKTDFGLIIVDMNQSIFIIRDPQEVTYAIWSGIPIMALIQRTLFEYAWQKSEKIEV